QRVSVVSPGEAETEVVVPDRQGDPVTVRGAGERGSISERATPKQTRDVYVDRRTCAYIISVCSRPRGLIGFVRLLTPFVDVAQHVEQPHVLRQQARTRPGVVAAIVTIPSILLEQTERVTIVAAGDRARTAGVFPFRLGWQAIARSPQEVDGDRHPRAVLLL